MNNRSKKKILFFVNSLDFFLSHRMPLINLAKTLNLDPIVCAPVKHISQKEINKYEFSIKNINILRSGKNIFKEINLFYQFIKIIISEKPKIVHLITIKPVLYGGIISYLFKRINFISSITGLGSSLIDNNRYSTLIKYTYKIITYSKTNYFIVQNENDKKFLLNLNRNIEKRIVLIPGSGYDKKLFYYIKEKKQKPIISFAGRILRHKGVVEYINAIKILRKKKYDNEFIIAGDIDELNPSSISYKQIKNWEKENLIRYVGFINDLSSFFKNINIFVMPSYREGFSKVLLEAAASGKAIITTDAPGCRDIIKDLIGGLLVKPGTALELSQAIELLINNEELRAHYGKNCSEFVLKNFTIEKILIKHKKLYSTLLNEKN